MVITIVIVTITIPYTHPTDQPRDSGLEKSCCQSSYFSTEQRTSQKYVRLGDLNILFVDIYFLKIDDASKCNYNISSRSNMYLYVDASFYL